MESLKYLYRIGSGPSSSHTLAPKNASIEVLKRYPNASKFIITLYGSLALTGKGHLTDQVIHEVFKNHKHEIIFDSLTEVGFPNTILFEVFSGRSKVDSFYVYSIGGGEYRFSNDLEQPHKQTYKEKNFYEIKDFCKKNKISLADYVYLYEEKDIKSYLKLVYKTMLKSIENGLNHEGVLPGSLKVERKAKSIYLGKSFDSFSTDLRELIAFSYAVAEENASGGVIVTSPTCGSCGVLPAVLKYALDKGFNEDSLLDALAVAGIIGNIVKRNASISGAQCGCQAEIGAASSMAAAFYAYVIGLDIDHIEVASEIAMEHSLGLTCDPVSGYVQIPCIERNAMASLRSVDSAILASYMVSNKQKISFDMVVKTMYETGLSLSKDYKETSIGGLAKAYLE